ncbi:MULTISPECIES: GntR family transcriptional regulator [unclassified Streptomyces]|uniref:GntR family transcriptional regulator n=1 Tax=unclassified Streptomyces TaxID=2593676 RepID=UPI000DC772C6|nr:MULTISPECIES: GntR family transcriptional regulator [unclassified Streptomyces]AWZ10020.1 GntR family transcriptional regulator [Streptomyces sp. ICC4]AWZ17747.1 GntR family transcriptional regulator [Streptomyces sp. ICC1]
MKSDGAPSQPKCQRIAAALKAAIEAGEYGPGDRLPGENDLMATYGVARMTARQALGVLQSEGLTEARKGAGVFVREFRRIRRRGIQRLAEDVWGEGRSIWAADTEDREPVVEPLSVTEEAAPEAIAALLGLSDGTAVVRRRRFLLDGKPVMFATSYLDAALVAGTPITEPDTGPGGIYARLAELGQKPARFREEVRSRMPTTEEAASLGLAAGTPVVLVARTAFAAGGRVVEVNEMVLDASAYVLEYEFDSP